MTVRLVCPECGSDQLEDISTVITTQSVRYYRDSDGHARAEFVVGEASEAHWDTSESVGVQCSTCGWECRGSDFRSGLVPAEPVVAR